MTRRVAALGVVVPARNDAGYAAATVEALLDSADRSTVPVSVILVDDGENGPMRASLPGDERLAVVTTREHGPGHARTAGAKAFAEQARALGVAAGEGWLVSLDADVSLPGDFVGRWVEAIGATDADILGGPAIFAPVGDEAPLPADVEAASEWMWSDTGLYEHFVGLVNVGGCNHAVSIEVARANTWYLQPTAVVEGTRRIVPGDDWDFGLRARMSGWSTGRVREPAVTTSVRRIAADPVGFLAGRSYERPFEPIRGSASPEAWPPAESWQAVSSRGRARLVAHFLAKPLLAGLAPKGELDWFLGPELRAEWEAFARSAPTWQRGADWNAFRTALIDLCFADEVFGWCRQVARRIAGVS
ncbi:MAG: glycosyltransferase [Acidimicrobiaceae bacterium]|nr:glycosyltransferase [Acidimicrobiaceae bacterium]